ncbi:MAG: polyhydroxyalkanoate synthesis regulator DNA-binding domain-containing protein [Pseudomonadota bacterium]
MPERVFRKYANRRLYDTVESRTVTLDDVAEAIARGERVRIVEAKTERDVTRPVLIQILADQELLGRPLLSDDVLMTLIRCYRPALRDPARAWIEASLGQFEQGRDDLLDELTRLADASPAGDFGRLARESVEQASRLQAETLQRWVDWMMPSSPNKKED